MPVIITVQEQEMYDDRLQEFVYLTKPYDLILEHSLVSISKWESKYHKPYPYINKNMTMTPEESNYYIRCMTINKDVPDMVYNCLTRDDMKKINDYINDPMSGTTVKMYNNNPGKTEILSSELLYYYMFKLGIPKDCEKWHINRLITLIEVYGVKDGSETNKMSRGDLVARNKAINARNRAKFHSKG